MGWDWHVGVFCHNEAARIAACLDSIANAASGKAVITTIVCNGTTDGSAEVARQAAERAGLAYTIVGIAHGDKSNAINQFIYALDRPARFVCCVDAFVRVGPRTLQAFEDAYARYPAALILSSLALSGRTEPERTRRILESGGETTGQLYAPRTGFLERIRRAGFRLPVDLYRGDGLLGGMAAHDLDPVANAWDNGRVVGVEDATYAFDPLTLSPADLRRQIHRRVRQMRGRLENAGIRSMLANGGFGALPPQADGIIAWLLETSGVPPTAWLDRPFMALAIRRSRRHRPVDAARLIAHKIAEGGPPPARGAGGASQLAPG